METQALLKNYHIAKKRMLANGYGWFKPLGELTGMLLDKAYHFNMGPCYQDLRTTDTTDPGGRFKLPFPITLLSTDADETAAPFVALLLEEEIAKDTFKLDSIANTSDCCDFVCLPFVSATTKGTPILLPFGYLARVPWIGNLDECTSEKLPTEVVDPRMVVWAGKMGIEQNLYTAITVSLARYFARLLNCKNVELRERPKPQKHRLLKKKNESNTVTKDIIIKIPGKRILYEGGTEGEIHFKDIKKAGLTGQKRGHFKTYTEERPLFGKYTGTWWWAPVFGTKHRNYQVEETPEE